MPTPEERARAIIVARERNARAIESEIASWQREIGPAPSSAEIAISPLNVPLIVGDDVDARRRAPDGKIYRHNAIDVYAQTDLPSREVGVVATVSGRVLFVGEWDAASGHTVFVGGRDGRIYSFAHLDSSSVQVGQSVTQGEFIGVYGRSGNARHREGGNLHYTVRAPLAVVSPEETDPLVAASDPLSLTPADTGPSLTKLSDFEKIWPTINGVKATRGKIFEPGIPQDSSNPAIALPQANPADVIAPPTITGGEACDEHSGPGPCPAVMGINETSRWR
jgi:murein DD-endopeptidase MepM/ murein hydrolase activator NlpD